MSEVRLHVSGIRDFFDGAADAARRIDATMPGDVPEGVAKGVPGEVASEIAFESMELLLKILTPNRWRLLKRLKLSGATSIRRLAQALGRDYRGVHADVVALIEVGLIEKTADGAVFVPWDRITADMSLDAAA